MACYLMKKSERKDRENRPLASCVPVEEGVGYKNCSNRKRCSAHRTTTHICLAPVGRYGKTSYMRRTLDEIRKKQTKADWKMSKHTTYAKSAKPFREIEASTLLRPAILR